MSRGYFKEFGGRFVPETLMPALDELEEVYLEMKDDPDFVNELNNVFIDFSKNKRRTSAFLHSSVYHICTIDPAKHTEFK